MHGYGSFCPVAKAAEILSERWTLLVLRNMWIGGARRFNDILGGVPRMSPTLLAKRLRTLRDKGVIELRPAAGGRGWEYQQRTPIPTHRQRADAAVLLMGVDPADYAGHPTRNTRAASVRDRPSSATALITRIRKSSRCTIHAGLQSSRQLESEFAATVNPVPIRFERNAL